MITRHAVRAFVCLLTLGLLAAWDAPAAEAGGFCLKDMGRSIKKRVKKAGERVEKHTKRTGRRIEKHAKRAGDGIERTAKSAVKHTKRAVQQTQCAFGFGARRVQTSVTTAAKATTTTVKKATKPRCAPSAPC